MKSYKCPHCNLTNWMEAEVCKRCWMPNPFHPEMQGIEQQAPPPQFQENFAQQNFQQSFAPTNHQSNFQADPNLPPPPNLYGHRIGEAADQTNGFGQQRLFNSNSISPAEIDEFENAKKKIKSAGRAGLVWSILLGIGSVLMLFLSVMIQKGPTQNPEAQNAVQAVWMTSGIFIFITILISSLTYGTYKKSMFCTVTLLVLTCLGFLNNLSKVGSTDSPSYNFGALVGTFLISGLLIILFAQGIKGISTFRRFKEKYPNLE